MCEARRERMGMGGGVVREGLLEEFRRACV